jgi:uncharacterized protein
MSVSPYAPLDRFIAPARAKAELWRIVVAVVLTGVAFVILTQTLLALITQVAGPIWSPAVLRALQGGRSALGVIVILFSFLPLAIALALALRVLHDRSWTTLLGPAALTRRSFAWVAGSLVALQLLLLPVQILSPQVGQHLTFAQQWPWLVPAVLGIILQASTEEALFRGYLLQQLAARNLSPLVWMALPSALFALMHLDADAAAIDQIWSCGVAFGFGLAAADLTARTGTLGPAIGMHVGSNIGGLLLVGLYGRMDGLAAWNLVLNPMQPWAGLPYMLIDAMAVLVAWLLARLVLRV